MTHFAHFAKIFAHLAEYRKVLMQEAQSYGWPLIRQMVRTCEWKVGDEQICGRPLCRKINLSLTLCCLESFLNNLIQFSLHPLDIGCSLCL